MPVPSQIRRIVVVAAVGCVMLAWSSAAAARPLYDPTPHPTPAAASTAEPRTSPAGESGDWTLPITLAGAVVLLVVGTVGYSHRARTSRRATA